MTVYKWHTKRGPCLATRTSAQPFAVNWHVITSSNAVRSKGGASFFSPLALATKTPRSTVSSSLSVICGIIICGARRVGVIFGGTGCVWANSAKPPQPRCQHRPPIRTDYTYAYARTLSCGFALMVAHAVASCSGLDPGMVHAPMYLADHTNSSTGSGHAHAHAHTGATGGSWIAERGRASATRQASGTGQ